MTAFNPFSKQIGSLEISDLQILSSIAEGWYIEYKSEVPNITSIAKSISAFSNTYGGWLFYGIQEKSKSDPVADTSVGIDAAKAAATLQQIRQAADQCVNPTPYFETQILWGNGSALGVKEGRFIVAVYCPEGNNAPYVHKDGRIYRRVADGSEPKSENDRFLLDQLWKRSEKAATRLEEWQARIPDFSEREKQTPYVRIMIDPDPWRHHALVRKNLSVSDFARILKVGKSSSELLHTPFDTFTPSNRGVICRQVKNNDPTHFGFVWNIGFDLRSDVFIPLNVYEYRNDAYDFATTKLLLGQKGIPIEFVDKLLKSGHTRARIADLNQVFATLCGCITSLKEILHQSGAGTEIGVKIQLINVARTIPFVSSKILETSTSTLGVPISFEQMVTYPARPHPDAMLKFDFANYTENDTGTSYVAYLIFRIIAHAYGLIDYFDETVEHGELSSELVAAAKIMAS